MNERKRQLSRGGTTNLANRPWKTLKSPSSFQFAILASSPFYDAQENIASTLRIIVLYAYAT